MSSGSSNVDAELTIFRLYVHSQTELSFDTKFKQIDIILDFAIEHPVGSGKFKSTWNIDVEWLQMMKKKYPQLRVVISLGGVGSEYPFNPVDPLRWIINAVSSIKHIISLYGQKLIDGIDIHYDVIESTEEDFSFCIGDVIKQLRNDKHLSIKVVSIAPTKLVESYYLKLYSDNKDIIDLVDYQFYNENFSSKNEFVKLYEKLVVDYSPAKVLPGISIFANRISKEAIADLIDKKLIPGYFVWNPNDHSPVGTNPFSLENMLE
ncbi:chitinase 1-like [Vicia villosa]|uniref:chitinase 1-like n=1 Tax=Vicia villosa TaxID=3911 RepID=UPI00273CEEB8|nr:chitinase 1-like [Vicia villosa]